MHFFKNDIDLCSNHSRINRHQNDPSGLLIQSVICRDALHLLAETVDHCFYYLRSIMCSILQPWLSCLTYPGDLDLQHQPSEIIVTITEFNQNFFLRISIDYRFLDNHLA
ncbi:unnamed protein product [Schistosoma margrebowiei]|uniref:Uncharacterized protein n=1 Tax=Schistosoma margrebowiei TaxID=48269 RepID=A0A3P8FJB6_9TREM|nr:unnamed protein product [Schistosoma margrebowiei]